jgi:excisionase family DNA binding protein
MGGEVITIQDEIKTAIDDYLEMFICGATNFCEFYDAEELLDIGRGGAVMRKRNDNTMNSLLKMQQACNILGVHATTLRRWSAAGLIKEYRIGPRGHRMYKAEDVIELIEAS